MKAQPCWLHGVVPVISPLIGFFMGVVVLTNSCISAEGDGMAELDIDLLSKFRCLGTEDRDVLIEDFHSLLSGQMSRQECAFFLEMSNWYIMFN